MTKLNQAIWSIPMPDRIKRLPISPTGYPVPWFVAWIDGKPDFRVIGPDRLVPAIKRKLCWVCGQPMGLHMAFTIGPMCSITRTIAEPPAHLECADYSVRACPFLSTPRMRRNEKDLPENRVDAAGLPIMRNPGAVAIWITKTARAVRAGRGNEGILFELGDPERVLWFAQGRTATRAEVLESIDTGFALLMQEATKEGPDAVLDLNKMTAEAMKHLPER